MFSSRTQGSKLWRLAYRCDGKQKTLALGAYPAVSLADARQKRDGAKKLLASGVDPAQQARTDKLHRLASSASTFDAVADEFLAKMARESKADATLTKKRWLVGIARADLGKPSDRRNQRGRNSRAASKSRGTGKL